MTGTRKFYIKSADCSLHSRGDDIFIMVNSFRRDRYGYDSMQARWISLTDFTYEKLNPDGNAEIRLCGLDQMLKQIASLADVCHSTDNLTLVTCDGMMMVIGGSVDLDCCFIYDPFRNEFCLIGKYMADRIIGGSSGSRFDLCSISELDSMLDLFIRDRDVM